MFTQLDIINIGCDLGCKLWLSQQLRSLGTDLTVLAEEETAVSLTDTRMGREAGLKKGEPGIRFSGFTQKRKQNYPQRYISITGLITPSIIPY